MLMENLGSNLPQLQVSELDSDTVDAYFRDLQLCASVFAVIPKAGPGYVGSGVIDLLQGKSFLVAGQLRGLQIRYTYQDSEWWDTLIVRDGVVRMTRIEQRFL